MADFFLTNLGTVAGTSGEDRLTFTYNTVTNDVWLTGITPAATGGASYAAGGYAGYFNGAGGNDGVFSGIEHFTFVDLSGGNDWINTGDGNDILFGGAGNDTLAGGGGLDQIHGEQGTDFAQLGLGWATTGIRIDLNGDSTFLGGGLLDGVEGMDLTTGSGNDTIFGHSSSVQRDTVQAGAGNDSIRWWMNEHDTVDGGAGTDLLTVTYAVVTNDVWLTSITGSLATGYSGMFDGQGTNNLSFYGIERFSFSDASGGNDDIHTGDGADTLRGGAGNDRLYGEGGADSIDGGTGTDVWGGSFAASTAAFTINLNTGGSFPGGGSYAHIEGMDLVTGSGNDSIVGHTSSGVADRVVSGAGNDTIQLSMGGNDTVDGGAGDDLLSLVYATTTNDVWLTGLVGTLQTGYSGVFNGLDPNNVEFSGIERFSFTDLAGGNDIIHTGDGKDTLNGGDGNDTLDGRGGADSIDGGAGNDLWGGNFGTATAAFAIDLTTVASSFLGTGSVTGIEGLDLTTGSGSDTIRGHFSSAMSDAIRTGAGHDTVQVWLGGSDTVLGGTGTDLLSVINDAFTGGVWMTALADTQLGGYGGTFDGLGSNNVAFFEVERFSFVDVANGNDIITTGSGADTLRGGGGADRFDGAGGNDSLEGQGGNDTLDGGAGSDVLDGGEGNDSLTGGTGNDVYIIDAVGDVVVEAGAAGIDRVRTTLASYVLPAQIEHLTLLGSGDNRATGNALANSITGNTGDDLIAGGDGNDTLDGGAGSDTASYSDVTGTQGVRVSLALAGAQVTGAAGTDTLLRFENLRGSEQADVLTGNAGANALVGLDGADVLDGGAGADTMTGGYGSDTYYVRDAGDVVREGSTAPAGSADLVHTFLAAYTLTANVENGCIRLAGAADLTGNTGNNLLYAGTGNNVLDGVSGSDTVSYAFGVTGTQGVTVSLSTGVAAIVAASGPQATGGSGSDTLLNIDHLRGSDNADTLGGSGTENRLDGANGNDRLSGLGGNDTLAGGNGNDTLVGGTGQDSLTGGSGNDLFDFDALADSSLATPDVITDFTAGQDRIDLSSLDADTTVAGNQPFTALVSAFTGPAQLRLAGNVLYANVDADADAEFAVQLLGVTALGLADFVL